jgi:hypothetical protein
MTATQLPDVYRIGGVLYLHGSNGTVFGMADYWRGNQMTYELDTEMNMPVYVIRGGPEPEPIPFHVWGPYDLLAHEYADDGPRHSWRLYRLVGAPPIRLNDDGEWTWVPIELDTPERRERRSRQGHSANYEVLEEPK